MYLGIGRWLIAIACMTLVACSSASPTSPSSTDAGPVISQGPLAGLVPEGPPPVPDLSDGPPGVQAIGVTRFLAFGDSITAGTLSSFDGSFLYDAPSHSYTERLRLGLNQFFPGQPGQSPRTYTVINAGVPGENAANIPGLPPGGESRIQREITNHRPQAVLLLEGINDMGGAGRSALDTARAVERIVNTIRANNLPVLVATMMQTRESCNPNTGVCRDNARDKIPEFNAHLRDRLENKYPNVHVVDLYAAFGDNPALMGGDGLHPSEAGYQVMAEAFGLKIAEVFPVLGSFQ
jgi:lysophospholipase L1-like esterase